MKDRLIWYASYGSNLLKERFLCYIVGGTPNGRNDKYHGCRDKSLPFDEQEIYIQSELYFAKRSIGWQGGGVAFISIEFDQNKQTLGRMYLIKEQQFIDIYNQETNNSISSIDFDSCKKLGNLVFMEKSWFGNLVYLGEQENYPIFTFTNFRNLYDQINTPNLQYLKTIVKGIQETYPYSNAEIVEYLLPLKGLLGEFSKEELIAIIDK